MGRRFVGTWASRDPSPRRTRGSILLRRPRGRTASPLGGCWLRYWQRLLQRSCRPVATSQGRRSRSCCCSSRRPWSPRGSHADRLRPRMPLPSPHRAGWFPWPPPRNRLDTLQRAGLERHAGSGKNAGDAPVGASPGARSSERSIRGQSVTGAPQEPDAVCRTGLAPSLTVTYPRPFARKATASPCSSIGVGPAHGGLAKGAQSDAPRGLFQSSTWV